MNYKLRFHPEVSFEIETALKWYEKESATANQNLKKDLMLAFEKILSFPFSFRKAYKTFRCYPLKKFPYLIVYSVQNEIIYIVAFFPTRRNPEVLEERIKSL